MYQPKISEEHIRRLYRLRLQRQKPMTHVLDEILNAYFATCEDEKTDQGKVQSKSGDKKT